MASSPKLVCLFFLLTTLVFSLQTHGRDSQFFSKVTRNRDETPSTTPNTNKFFMNNQENEYEPLNKQQEHQEQPTFIPQTSETGGYGLYGHETGLNPPSSTKTSLYNMDENNNNNKKNNYEDFNNYYKNNNEDDEKNYAPELKGLSSTTYSTNVAPTKYVNNFNNNNNYNNDDDDDEGKYYFNGGVKRNNDVVQEKQGMSDTRFLENGKYFFDIDSEKNYEPKNNNYMSHHNNYNNNNNYETNDGYFGNKATSNRFDAYYDAYYRNNNKNKEMNNNNNYNFFGGNGMQGYKNNQVPQEEEFQFDDQP